MKLLIISLIGGKIRRHNHGLPSHLRQQGHSVVMDDEDKMFHRLDFEEYDGLVFDLMNSSKLLCLSVVDLTVKRYGLLPIIVYTELDHWRHWTKGAKRSGVTGFVGVHLPLSEACHEIIVMVSQFRHSATKVS